MKINVLVLPHIENALGMKLYEPQKNYLLSDGDYSWQGDRGSGKTLAYCIKLVLSEGKPLDMRYPERFSDLDYAHYSRSYFRQMFMEVWNKLNDYGFRVREIRR
jgi:hypothetical protein